MIHPSISLIAESQLPRPPEPRTTPHRRSSDLAEKKKNGMIPGSKLRKNWGNSGILDSQISQSWVNFGILSADLFDAWDVWVNFMESKNWSWSCLILWGRIKHNSHPILVGQYVEPHYSDFGYCSQTEITCLAFATGRSRGLLPWRDEWMTVNAQTFLQEIPWASCRCSLEKPPKWKIT